MTQSYATRGYATIFGPIDLKQKGADFSAIANNGYFADHGTPATKIVATINAGGVNTGDVIIIIGGGNTGRMRIAQDAGVTVHGVMGSTTTGAAGWLEPDLAYSSIVLRCIDGGNNDWVVESASGTWTVN